MKIDDITLDSTIADATGAIVFPRCMVQRLGAEVVADLEEHGFKNIDGALVFGEVMTNGIC